MTNASDEYRDVDATGGRRQDEPDAPDDQGADDGYEEREGDTTSSPFPHPPWTIGLVLVGGVITLMFGVLVNPIWLGVGAPFLIALALWLYVKLVIRP